MQDRARKKLTIDVKYHCGRAIFAEILLQWRNWRHKSEVIKIHFPVLVVLVHVKIWVNHLERVTGILQVVDLVVSRKKLCGSSFFQVERVASFNPGLNILPLLLPI